MAGPTDLMLFDLHAKYAAQADHPAFARLYADDDEFGHMFSVLHRKLNQHFEDHQRPGTHDPPADSDGVLRALTHSPHACPTRIGGTGARLVISKDGGTWWPWINSPMACAGPSTAP